MKWTFWVVLGGFLASVLFTLISDRLVESMSAYTYDEISDIPDNNVGLLLGTGKYLEGGRINLYYKNRIEAAAELYKKGKIEHILVSGDNSTKYYDEPNTMKEDLIEAGVPRERIHLDHAGFRTLDSVVRSKAIFGQNDITVISQEFQNERAIYIARSKGINAIGYNAEEVGGSSNSWMTLREKLARSKMVLDLIFGTEPKFYGKKLPIE